MTWPTDLRSIMGGYIPHEDHPTGKAIALIGKKKGILFCRIIALERNALVGGVLKIRDFTRIPLFSALHRYSLRPSRLSGFIHLRTFWNYRLVSWPMEAPIFFTRIQLR